MILSPPETCFLKCLYWKLSDTQMDNDCSNLLNKLLLSIIFHVITQNCLRDSIRGILKIDIHVSYSLPMPESAIIIVISKIDLKTNSPVSELSSDIFGWSHLAFYPVSQDKKTVFHQHLFWRYVTTTKLLRTAIIDTEMERGGLKPNVSEILLRYDWPLPKYSTLHVKKKMCVSFFVEYTSLHCSMISIYLLNFSS